MVTDAAGAGAVEPAPDVPGATTEALPGSLHKTLTVGRGVGVAITMIVGSGLLSLPGLAYADVGSAAVFAWVSAALVVLPLLVVFSLLGSRFPNAGGVVGFVSAAFGRAGAAPLACVLLGACAFGGAAMAITGGNYVAALVDGSWISSPAALVYLAVVGVLNALGSRLTGSVQTVITALLVLLVATVAAAPFVTPGTELPGDVAFPTDWPGVLRAVGLVFFAFNGWELVASTTEEYRNPRRDLPIVMASSFVVIVVLYVGVALAVQMAVGLDDPLLRKAPIVAVLRQVLGPAAGSAASLLGILIILATLTGGTWATSRIAFATARERLLPAALARVDDRTGAPVPAVALSVAMFAVVLLAHAAGLLSLATVFELAAVNFVLGYASSVLAFAVLFRGRRHRVLAVVAAVPVLVVLAGFGWNLLCPLVLVLAGVVAHRATRHTVSPAARRGPSRAA